MNDFMRARGELYKRLYQRFASGDGPYYDAIKFDQLREARGMKAAILFAKDMGHIKSNNVGEARLTAWGVIYAEEQGYCPGGE